MNKYKAILFMPCLAFAELDDNKNFDFSVKFNPKYSYNILDQTENIRKTEQILEIRRDNIIENSSLYLSTQIIPIIDFQSSNRDSKFGYLMRNPTSANQVGRSVSEVALHSAKLGVTGTISNWLTSYAELLYDPQQSFGAGTITSLGRNQIQLRRGFVAIGDLKKCPLSFSIGKIDGPFSQTFTVNPFTASTLWHAFGGLAYGALLEFNNERLKTSIMAVQGGSQFRMLNKDVNGTNVPSTLNNFILDSNYTLNFRCTDLSLNIGASYARGTTYCQDFPATHFKACSIVNPAWSVYGNIKSNKFILKAGFAKTTKDFPASHNPNPPLDIYPASKVSSIDIGAKYKFYEDEKWNNKISFEFSNFVAGATGSPWRRQNQFVFGLSCIYLESCKLFAEFVHTQGYAPFNFISGGNLSSLGETHSDACAKSTVFIIGVQASI